MDTIHTDTTHTDILIEQAVESLLHTSRSEYRLDMYDSNPFADRALENLLVFS